MFDLQVLAFQADVTRVITFQLARETSNRTYPEIGVPDPHHPTTHHGNDPEKIAKMAKINTFHVSLFAEFLEKLKATPDGDGSLLDHSLYLYGSGMGNPNVHDHANLPILVAGGAACGMKGGRHIQYDEPHAAGQPAPDAARPGRRPARLVRRQQRQGRRPVRSGVPVGHVRAACRAAETHMHCRRIAWTLSADVRPGRRSSGRPNARRSRTRPSSATRRASARCSTTRVDVNAAQVDGMTALHWAAYQRRCGDRRHCWCERAPTSTPRTATACRRCRWPARTGTAAVVKLLLDAGADANATLPAGRPS